LVPHGDIWLAQTILSLRYLVCPNLILYPDQPTLTQVRPATPSQPTQEATSPATDVRPEHPVRTPRDHQHSAADAPLVDFERAVAAVMRLLADRDTLGDIAARSGHDLPPASWSLLEYLDGYGPLRVSDIAACHGVDISSITPRLKSLERAGLVERRALASDARVSLIVITTSGRQALEAVHAARREIISDALGDIEIPRITAATEVLQCVADHISVVAERVDARSAKALPA
jgi:DNA-binding MarR family transcriptional regulator